MKKLVILNVVILLLTVLVFAATTSTGLHIINSTINSTPIGLLTPSTGAFTTVGASSSSISAAVSGTQRVNTGIINGAGLQLFTGTSCTTNTPGTNTFAVTDPGHCTSTITWSVSFADTNYAVFCQPTGLVTGPGSVHVNFAGPASASTASVSFINSDNNYAGTSVTFWCLGIHQN
jgi:hypothetical protein